MGTNTIIVGTVGESVFRSSDGGETFVRASDGMFMELDVRTLAVHPDDHRTVYAGTNAGLYVTRDAGDKWTRLNTPFDPGEGWPSGIAVWSILIDPNRPETLLVGTCPPALYRSDNAGQTWAKVDAGLSETCEAILYPRVTCIVADPQDSDTIWAGIEIDGIRRSDDGGHTWNRVGAGLSSQDVHAIGVVPGARKTILACTNNDLNISADNGETWVPQIVKTHFPWGYCRGLLQLPRDPMTLFLGNGNGPPGSEGALQMSRDGGRTWSAVPLPAAPNSTVWSFAASADSDFVVAATVSGQIFRSVESGLNWTKCPREFGEVRSLAVIE